MTTTSRPATPVGRCPRCQSEGLYRNWDGELQCVSCSYVVSFPGRTAPVPVIRTVVHLPKRGKRRKQEPVIDSPDAHVPTDDGCEASPSCLTCPLERCLLELPQVQQYVARNTERYKAMWERLRQGVPIREVAEEFHLSPRSIYRGLKSRNLPLPEAV